MADDDYLSFPGRELPKVWRDIAQRLVQEQGWTYRYKRKGGSHPRVIPPSGGLGVALPTTVTDGDAGHRASYLTALKRAGAILDAPSPARARSVGTPVFSAGMTTGIVQDIEKPFTDAEWRQRQWESDVWWRQHLAGPAPEPEPEPQKPAAPQLSAYAQSFLERARAADARATGVRDDAQGNGRFTLAEARQQLRDGYSLDAVVNRTGWGRLWLQDLADRIGA